MRLFQNPLSLLATSFLIGTSFAVLEDFNFYHRQDVERVRRAALAQYHGTLESRKADYRYYNHKTAPYFIESWPDVDFDTGEFYSGSVPIDESDPSRSLFFIFKPAENGPNNNLTIWLNGGPGCSSLIGFFQENGPILWQPGVYKAMKNPYAWSKYTNMLWVEQPVGTGFAVGKIEARNEIDISKDFVGFFKNWQNLFGIENYKIFVTGESYAGRYVPYISAQMLDQKDTKHFDLSGNIIYDPCIGEFLRVGMEIPTYDFVMANNEILGFSPETLADLEQQHVSCGYADYMERFLQFPPPKNQPDRGVYGYGKKCDIFDAYYAAAVKLNPCFNIYHITDYCPTLGNVLGEPQGLFKPKYYFDREDVKKALHAPSNVTWTQCSSKWVFKGKFKNGFGVAGPEAENDRSPDPIQGVLPQVIDATKRVMVSNANWDGLLLTNGTLLSIQNMTWGGKLGFQNAPSTDFVVPHQGIMGKSHYERGLLWLEAYQAGHQQPEYQPRAAVRHLLWMLGSLEEL